jgi:hypothetical protein
LRADGAPLWVAGLWDRWITADGEVAESFKMLTDPAEQHALFRRFHAPGKETRMGWYRWATRICKAGWP